MRYLLIVLLICSCSPGPDIDPMYCEMVELRRVDPNLGWPDYMENYDEVCQ